MKYIITGYTGFIGRSLIERLSGEEIFPNRKKLANFLRIT
jgi:nucleoside-diphosphate-sugar epimerase